MSRACFLEPVDVLYPRGNRPFGDPGSYGESLLPPWPSVAAGALRSRIYADTGKVLAAARDFRITGFHLARRLADGRAAPLFPLPADLNASRDESGKRHINRLLPRSMPAGIEGSMPLDCVPVMASDARNKPEPGIWLDSAGWNQYLHGKLPDSTHLRASSELWLRDERVGIGLDSASGRAENGKLFSMQAICLKPDIGFLVISDGNVPVPTHGAVRFGGDGRAVDIVEADPFESGSPAPEALAAAGRLRIVLTSPGIFPAGWMLPGMQSGGQWQLDGIRGRVVAAAVPGFGVVSGWDLVHRGPKPAQRVVPAGSVYWIENLKADPDRLGKLADHGLWSSEHDNESRRIEGYNRFHFAAA